MFHEMSRQEKLDRAMCRPGYRWNETLGRCIGGYAGGEIKKGPAKPEQPAETANGAIKQESVKRAQPAPAPKAVK